MPLKLSPTLRKDLGYGEYYAEAVIQFALLVGALIPNDGLSTRNAAYLAVATRIAHVISNRLSQGIAIGRGVGVVEITPKAAAGVVAEVDKVAETVVPQAASDVNTGASAGKIVGQVEDDVQKLESARTPDPPVQVGTDSPVQPVPLAAVPPTPVPPAA